MSTKHGAQWAGKRFMAFVRTYYDIDPPQVKKQDWRRYYQKLEHIAVRLGGYEEVVAMAAWWFKLVSPRLQMQMVDPAGLWPWIPEYEEWLEVNRSLIERMGVEGTCDYLQNM